jgi:hypothetical protein
MVEDPGDTVGRIDELPMETKTNIAVALVIDRAGPQPAGGGFFDATPEPGNAASALVIDVTRL